MVTTQKLFSRTFTAILAVLVLHSVSAFAVPTGPVVGKVSVVLGTVTGTDADGDVFQVVRGAPLHAGYSFQTGSRAFVRLEMTDGTRLTLGRNGSATIDQFSFNPAASFGEFKATVRLGGFKYRSGQIGKFNSRTRHSTISTPTAVIGIRGSILTGMVERNGRTTTILESGNANVTSNSGGVVNLASDGNTAETDALGDVNFFAQPTVEQQQRVDRSLPTPEQESAAGASSSDDEEEDEEADEEDADEDEEAVEADEDPAVDGEDAAKDSQDDADDTQGDSDADDSFDQDGSGDSGSTEGGDAPGTGSGGGGGGAGSPSGAAPPS